MDFRYLSINYEDRGADLKLDTYGPRAGRDAAVLMENSRFRVRTA
jgi:hypothetical protein